MTSTSSATFSDWGSLTALPSGKNLERLIREGRVDKDCKTFVVVKGETASDYIDERYPMQKKRGLVVKLDSDDGSERPWFKAPDITPRCAPKLSSLAVHPDWRRIQGLAPADSIDVGDLCIVEDGVDHAALCTGDYVRVLDKCSTANEGKVRVLRLKTLETHRCYVKRLKKVTQNSENNQKASKQHKKGQIGSFWEVSSDGNFPVGTVVKFIYDDRTDAPKFVDEHGHEGYCYWSRLVPSSARFGDDLVTADNVDEEAHYTVVDGHNHEFNVGDVVRFKGKNAYDSKFGSFIRCVDGAEKLTYYKRLRRSTADEIAAITKTARMTPSDYDFKRVRITIDRTELEAVIRKNDTRCTAFFLDNPENKGWGITERDTFPIKKWAFDEGFTRGWNFSIQTGGFSDGVVKVEVVGDYSDAYAPKNTIKLSTRPKWVESLEKINEEPTAKFQPLKRGLATIRCAELDEELDDDRCPF